MSSLDFVGAAFLGLILLGITLGIRAFTADAGMKLTSDTIVQENMNEFTQTFQWEMDRVGYRDSTGQPIVTSKVDTLGYYADTDGDGVAEFIRYFLSPPAWRANTPNPYDATLLRTRRYKIGGTTYSDTQRTTIGFTKFVFGYVDSLGAATTNPSYVRGIRVSAKIESPEKYLDSTYSGVSWQSKYYPKNLVR